MQPLLHSIFLFSLYPFLCLPISSCLPSCTRNEIDCVVCFTFTSRENNWFKQLTWNRQPIFVLSWIRLLCLVLLDSLVLLPLLLWLMFNSPQGIGLAFDAVIVLYLSSLNLFFSFSPIQETYREMCLERKTRRMRRKDMMQHPCVLEST